MIESRIKISVVLPNLRAGGAERVMSFIAQKVNPKKFETTLVIIGLQTEAAYQIHDIDLVFFDRPRVLSGVRDLFSHIRKQKPDIVFSAIGHLNTVTAYMSWLFPKIKFVAREVNVLSILATFDEKSRGFSLLGYLGKHRFNRFDKIVCQSQDMLKDLNKTNNISQEKLVVINNPVTSEFTVKNSDKVSEPIRFITVARLVKQKGHARIIEALGKIDFPFHYTLVGDGPEKTALYERIKALGFSEQVTNIAFTNEVYKYLAESDLYLQGSFVEGFPNAIIESCMVGTPVLAFNAPGGINEIIFSGINGYVVDDEYAYVEKLKAINADFNFNKDKVSETISSRYSENIIIGKYEELFIKLAK